MAWIWMYVGGRGAMGVSYRLGGSGLELNGMEGRRGRMTCIDSGWERTRGDWNRGEEGEDDWNRLGVEEDER